MTGSEFMEAETYRRFNLPIRLSDEKIVLSQSEIKQVSYSIESDESLAPFIENGTTPVYEALIKTV
jgi:hypothetical protein